MDFSVAYYLYMFYFCIYFIYLHLYRFAESFYQEKKKVTVEKAQGPVSQGAWNG